MKIYIHSGCALMQQALPLIARQVELQAAGTGGEWHLVDVAYTSPAHWLSLLTSGLSSGHDVVFITRPETAVLLPDCDALRLCITLEIHRIIENVIHFISGTDAGDTHCWLLPHLLTRLDDRTLRLYLYGVRVGDIAQAHGVSKNRIYSRLNHARRKMGIRSLQHLSHGAVADCRRYECALV